MVTIVCLALAVICYSLSKAIRPTFPRNKEGEIKLQEVIANAFCVLMGAAIFVIIMEALDWPS